MPIIKSAKKRVKTTKKASVRNAKTKRTLKGAIKAFHSAVTGKSSKSGDAHKKAQSAIDKAAKKGVMHKNKAARKKKQLAAAAKKSGVKSVGTKKVAAKKPVAKKAPVKKAVAKKAPAKKAVSKKK
jgi:small subunit ribosomal protein S20